MSNGSSWQYTPLFHELADPTHPIRMREWDVYQQRRDEIINQFAERMGLWAAGPIGQQAIDFAQMAALQESADRQFSPGMAGADSQHRGKPDWMRERDWQQMIGAAQSHKIEDPAQYSVGELEQLLEEARMRRQDDPDAPALSFVRTARGMASIGNVDAFVRALETAPFIGKHMSEREGIRQINRDLGHMREAYTSHLTGPEATGAAVMEGAGHLAGYSVIGYAAWKAAGGLLGVLGIASLIRGGPAVATTLVGTRGSPALREVPIAMGNSGWRGIMARSAQGGTASLMLESGGDGPLGEKVMNVAIGTGLGAAFEVGGRLGAMAFGGVAGGLVGAAADEPGLGAAIGIAAGLGLNRGMRFARHKFGLNQEKLGGYWEFGSEGFQPGNSRWAPGMADYFVWADPQLHAPPASMRALIAGRAQLAPGPQAPVPAPGLPPVRGPSPAGLLPEQSATTAAIDGFTYRGTRSLFYSGNENPTELIERWSTMFPRGALPEQGVAGTAIRLPDRSIVHSLDDHHQMLRTAIDDGRLTEEAINEAVRKYGGDAIGYVTTEGRFVTRKEALEVGRAADQVFPMGFGERRGLDNLFVREFAPMRQVGGDPDAPTMIRLDNTGRMMPGARHVHEVEARFNNAFVLQPNSLEVFRHLVGPDAQSLPQIQRRLSEVGFDGLVVQGMDNLVEAVGPDIVQQSMGVPGDLVQDAVYAFGTPNQVRFSRPIVDGDRIEEAFNRYGSHVGRRVAGVEAANFSTQATKQLRPFVTAKPWEPLRTPPEWLSEAKGVHFLREPGHQNPLVPPNVERAVFQNHPHFGPRILLLDEDGIAISTQMVESMEDGTSALSRMGFQRMDPNTTEEAIGLAHKMSKMDFFLNNSYYNHLARHSDWNDTDLVAIAYADNPGRLAVVSGIDDPFDLRRRVAAIARDRYDHAFDPQKNLHIVERPAGTFHAIVGPEDLLTPKKVEQFKEFGVFSGLQARTTEGNIVRVNSVWREKSGRARVSVSPVYGDIETKMSLEHIFPDRASVVVPIPRGAFEDVKKFALKEFNKEAKAAGQDLAESIIDDRVLSQLDYLIGQYAAEKGIHTPYDVFRLKGSIEYNLAQEIKRNLGEEGAFYDIIVRDAANARTQAMVQGRELPVDIYEAAHARGFIWEPAWRGKPGQLVDQSSNTVIPFQTEDSAIAFLVNYKNEMAEVGSLDAVFGDISQAFPGTHVDQSPTGIDFATQKGVVEDMEESIRRNAQQSDKLGAAVERFSEVMDAAEDAGWLAMTEDEILAARRIFSDYPEGSLTDPIPFSTEPPAGGAGEPPGPPRPPIRTPPPPEPPDDGGAVGRAIDRNRRGDIVDPSRKGPVWNETEAMLNQIRDATTGRKFYHQKELRDLMNLPNVHILAPARVFAAKVDDKFRDFGVSSPRLWESVDEILQAKSIAVNESLPWAQEMWDIVSVFNRSKRRGELHRRPGDGELYRIGPLYDVMTADPTMIVDRSTGLDLQTHLMNVHGFTDVERQAVHRLRNLLDRLHDHATDAGMDIGYIFDYLPRLRYFHEIHGNEKEKAWAEWSKLLPDHLKWFALYAREGNLQHYQKDVGRVMDTYIRGLFFEKHVAGPMAKAKAVWMDQRVPHPLRLLMDHWMFVTRHGYPSGHDSAVRMASATINKGIDALHKVTGLPKAHVTEGETLNAFGTLLTAWYRNLLGYSPRAIIREFLQPMLGAAEIGYTPILSGYVRYIKNPRVRAEWNARADRHGWSEPNRNAVVNSEFFTGELSDFGGASMFSEEQLLARESYARILDKIHDRLPHRLRRGIENDPLLNPLYFYRVGATNPGRVIASNAYYENARRHISAFRAGKISFEKMLERSGVNNQYESPRQKFIRHIMMGQDDLAAVTMGNEGAKTQFLFGIAEQSELIRSSGITGRFAMNFGNFANQIAWWTGKNWSNQNALGKAKFIARIGVLPALAEVGGRTAEWAELNRFNWFRSLSFSGGVPFDLMLNIMRSMPAAVKILMGEELSPEERFAASRFQDLVGNIPINPYGGATRTLNGYMQALTDPENPIEAFFRMTLTGTPKSAELEAFMRERGEDMIESVTEFHDKMFDPLGLKDRIREHFGQQQREGISPQEWQEYERALREARGDTVGGGARD